MNVFRTAASTGLASAIAGIALIGAGLGVTAQDATPTVVPPVPTSGMTAAIHQGSCQTPVPQEIASLGSFGQPTSEDGQIIETQGIQTSPALLQAAADGVAFNLNESLASGEAFVVLVHQSPEQYSTYLACGEIAGPVINDTLAVGLRPINNAGFAGITTFAADGENVSATSYLMSDILALSGGTTSGTPEAQPTPIAAQGTFPPTEAPTQAPTETPAPPTQEPTATVAPPTATVAPPVEVTTTPAVVEVTPTPVS